jgi:hypothetical protein
MALCHNRGQQGDDLPVRFRFANLPAEPGSNLKGKTRERYDAPAPRAVLERGLTTADLKQRVALKEKASVRPPDEAKLGPKNAAQHALAGPRVQEYGTENYSKVNLVHTKYGPRWVERTVTLRNKVPEPDDGNLKKWAAQTRAFRRKQRDNELKSFNEKLKASCANIQKREAALVRAELRPASRPMQQPYKPPMARSPSESQLQRVHGQCPGLICALRCSPESPPALAAAGESGSRHVSTPAPSHRLCSKHSMYELDGLLFPAPLPRPDVSNREGAWVSLSLRGLEGRKGDRVVRTGKAWKESLRQDLITEIAVVLGLADEEVHVEKLWLLKDGAAGTSARQGVGTGIDGLRTSGIGALVLLLPAANEGDEDLVSGVETPSSRLASILVQIIQDNCGYQERINSAEQVLALTESVSLSVKAQAPLDGLEVLRQCAHARQLALPSRPLGKGWGGGAGRSAPKEEDGKSFGQKGGAVMSDIQDEVEELEYARFREEVLGTIRRRRAYAFDEMAFVLLQAVAVHGDTAAAHHRLRRVLAQDLTSTLLTGDAELLESVLLPLARVYEPLHRLRTAMARLRARCQRARVWTRTAREAVATAVELLRAGEEARTRHGPVGIQEQIECVLTQDCAGLPDDVRAHVLCLFRLAAPFARVAADAEKLGAALSGGGEEGGGGGGHAEDGSGTDEEEVQGKLRDEDVEEAVKQLFDAVRVQYAEHADDAGRLARVFLLAVGGLLRSCAPPPDRQDAVSVVYTAVEFVRTDVKRQEGKHGLAALVGAAQEALHTFALTPEELELVRNDIVES